MDVGLACCYRDLTKPPHRRANGLSDRSAHRPQPRGGRESPDLTSAPHCSPQPTQSDRDAPDVPHVVRGLSYSPNMPRRTCTNADTVRVARARQRTRRARTPGRPKMPGRPRRLYRARGPSIRPEALDLLGPEAVRAYLTYVGQRISRDGVKVRATARKWHTRIRHADHPNALPTSIADLMAWAELVDDFLVLPDQGRWSWQERNDKDALNRLATAASEPPSTARSLVMSMTRAPGAPSSRRVALA
jgi:hypothetical protein